MSEPTATAGLPTRLLLATDLSPRCDRALDRALQLAQEWSAELCAFNALELSAPDQTLAWLSGADSSTLEAAAHRQLMRDLAGIDVHVSVVAAPGGDAAAAIRDAARAGDVVVTGVARAETFGRFLLGSTVARLARSLVQPLLVVRLRARTPYHRIVVATDLSEPSAHALRETVRLFPQRELILYHSREPLTGDTVVDNTEECARFLDGIGLAPEALARIRVVVETGAPEQALAAYARANDVDLVVIGSHGRSGLASVLLGSVAVRMLDWLPCDTLVVRAPGH